MGVRIGRSILRVQHAVRGSGGEVARETVDNDSRHKQCMMNNTALPPLRPVTRQHVKPTVTGLDGVKWGLRQDERRYWGGGRGASHRAR